MGFMFHCFYWNTVMKPVLTPRSQTIDRGPAWIAATLSCAIIAMHYGILNCGSLYYPSWMDVTGYPISVVSWLVTGQFAIAFCLAPAYSRLLEKIPNRIGALIGTLLTSGTIIIAAFTNNFFTFMVPYTIFGGIGLGLTVIPVLGILAEYFDRYRVLALALAASGSGFGTFIFSKLDSFLIETYTWRIALIAQALLHLNVFPLRLLLRPIPPEPVAEPTIFVPDQPDLTICDLPNLKPEQPARVSEYGASNMLVSLLSVNSIRSSVAGSRFRCSVAGDDGARKARPGHNVRVVIEYVKMTCLPNQRDAVITGPISFLSSPGPGVMEQLESEAREYFCRPDLTADTVLIPLMFVLGENDSFSAANIASSRRGLDVPDTSEYTGSRYDLGSAVDMGDMSQVYRQLVIGDSFASSMVAAHERRQLKRTTDYFAPPTNATNFGSDDRVCVLGYYGPDDATIPEEVELEDGTVQPHTDNTGDMNLLQDPNEKVDRLKPLTQSTQMLGSTNRLQPVILRRKSRSSIRLGSVSQLSRVDKYGEACYRSRDVFASVISVNTPHEAAELLVSKLDDEAKLENFGLEMGFGEERSATLLSFVGVTAMIGRLGMGFVGQFFERMDIRFTSAFCLLLVSGCVALLPIFQSYSAISALCIIYGLLVSPSFAFAPGMTFQIVGPQRYDEAVSYLFQFEAVGFLIGGPVGGE
ncbi:unnamed protein product [Echinostoma caproni]|uniref:MFS domain-containing protein n=1 Tax=Echinostoma caproni TaxID=27848 RepID=A0A183AML8_9TREM|nr:unnamed protein product [Echinostoma caproni]